MNKYETLKADMTKALKDGDKERRLTLADIVATIDKTSTSGKTRLEITDALVDEVLIKYQKTIQEMIDTCPAERTDLLEKYQAEMEVVKLYAPQLMTNRGEIERTINDILNGEVPLTKANRGSIMKLITPYFKGKADMKIVSQVVSEMLV